jgi:hypothetical protein
VGLSKGQINRLVPNLTVERLLTLQAQKAFDCGIPMDQGPVWYDHEAWKTDFWIRQWRLRQAFKQGQEARKSRLDIDANPHQKARPPFSTEGLALDLAWRAGYQSNRWW